MAVKFKARSSTPGSVVLADGVMDNLLAASNVRNGTDRGDGTLGTMPAAESTEPARRLSDDSSSIMRLNT